MWVFFHSWCAGVIQLVSGFLLEGTAPCVEKELATHSSVLAWRIPGTGEPGGLLSLGLHRVRHDWSDLAAAAAAAPCVTIGFVCIGGCEFRSPLWCYPTLELSFFHFLKLTVWLSALKDRWHLTSPVGIKAPRIFLYESLQMHVNL